MNDRRPDPKPRKHYELWQMYQWYDELEEMRKRHLLRISSAERGKSRGSVDFERQMMEEVLGLDANIARVEGWMIKAAASTVGPIWKWLTGIKGLGTGHLAAPLVAQIDDPALFSTISKLWRFCGLAVIDGKAEVGTQHYCRRLKALLLGPTLIVDQFIYHYTPVYRDVYDREKARLAELYPEPLCAECGKPAVLKSKSWVCPDRCEVRQGFKVRHTPLHLDKMARRKVAKIFISHLWLKWREYEGLPVTLPYILRQYEHEHFMEPAEVEPTVV